jgi:hypothetical protein
VTDLVAEIEQAFGSERMPSKEDLVRFDSFDEPAKVYLLEHLHGRTQDDLLRLLREGALGTGAMCTEELEVAEPGAIRYYLKPFLVHLADNITRDARALDDETPFFLFAHVRNILEHRGHQIFTDSQLKALASLVEASQALLSSLPEGIWTEDVSKQARDLGEVLGRA